MIIDILPTTNQPYYEGINYQDMWLLFNEHDEPIPHFHSNLHIESMERAIVDDFNHYRLHLRGNITLSADIAYLRVINREETFTVRGYIYNNIFRCKRSDIIWEGYRQEPKKEYQPDVPPETARIQLRGQVEYNQTRTVGM